MEDVIDENTRPEDIDYAVGVAVDIRKWVTDRFCENQSLVSFRHPDCKEHFMKISEKYLTMACKVLIDQEFLVCEGKRIPVFALTQSALQQLEKEFMLKQQAIREAEIAMENDRQQEREDRKRQRVVNAENRKAECLAKGDINYNEDSEDDNSDDESMDRNVDLKDRHISKKIDLKSDKEKDSAQIIRDQPFAMLCKSDFQIPNSSEICHSLVVTDLNSKSDVTAVQNIAMLEENKKDIISWDVVIRTVTNMIDPVEGFCDYYKAFQRIQEQYPTMTQERYDLALQEGEKSNMIMKIDDQIFPI